MAAGLVPSGVGSAPAESAALAGDKANDASLIDLTIGTETLDPTFDSNKFSYTIASATGTDGAVTATPAQAGAKVEITYDGKNVVNGGTIKFSGTKTLTVTVKNGLGVMQYTVQITKGG